MILGVLGTLCSLFGSGEWPDERKHPTVSLNGETFFVTGAGSDNIKLRWKFDMSTEKAVFGDLLGTITGSACFFGIPAGLVLALFMGPTGFVLGVGACALAGVLPGVSDFQNRMAGVRRMQALAREGERQIIENERARQAERKREEKAARLEEERQRERERLYQEEWARRQAEARARERAERLAYLEQEFSVSLRRFAQRRMEEDPDMTFEWAAALFREHMHMQPFAREPDAALLDSSRHPDVMLVRGEGPLGVRQRVFAGRSGALLVGRDGQPVRRDPEWHPEWLPPPALPPVDRITGTPDDAERVRLMKERWARREAMNAADAARDAEKWNARRGS